MRRAGAATLAAWLVGWLAGACGGSEAAPAATLSVAVSPTPATVGPGRILLALVDSAAAPVPGAAVSVTARPPGGAEPRTVDAAEEAPGRYVVAAFPFDVPGDWTLEARARLPAGGETAARHPILVVGPPAR